MKSKNGKTEEDKTEKVKAGSNSSKQRVGATFAF